MNIFTIKIIALILMLIDHIGEFFPDSPICLCAREISCNGKRGKSLKWLFYAAYPLQFLVLYGISYYK